MKWSRIGERPGLLEEKYFMPGLEGFISPEVVNCMNSV